MDVRGRGAGTVICALAGEDRGGKSESCADDQSGFLSDITELCGLPLRPQQHCDGVSLAWCC